MTWKITGTTEHVHNVNRALDIFQTMHYFLSKKGVDPHVVHRNWNDVHASAVEELRNKVCRLACEGWRAHAQNGDGLGIVCYLEY